MCIYLGQDGKLTYTTQEHVLPAALGCCTKLDKGVVSDDANKFFSPIEQDVIKHSPVQIPRIFLGPGKRGKLSPKYATTSGVIPIIQSGIYGLGYMKGPSGYILSQFIINQENKVQFHYQPDDNCIAQNEIMNLKEQIATMGEKYVPVEMPQDNGCVYVAYFEEKIHIGFYGKLSDERVREIKNLFIGDIATRVIESIEGQITGTLPIDPSKKNLYLVVAKSAINTLAYIKGAEYIIQTNKCNELINRIMSKSDKILNNVQEIEVEKSKRIRQMLHLNNDQQFCIVRENKKQLKAWVFFYDYAFDVLLCNGLKSPFGILMDGIVCDWKNRKDYRYLDYLNKMKQ